MSLRPTRRGVNLLRAGSALACVAVGVVIYAGVAGAFDHHDQVTVQLTLPPCVTEDSNDCYWDAAHRGTHHGWSFVNIRGTVFYQGVDFVMKDGQIRWLPNAFRMGGVPACTDAIADAGGVCQGEP